MASLTRREFLKKIGRLGAGSSLLALAPPMGLMDRLAGPLDDWRPATSAPPSPDSRRKGAAKVTFMAVGDIMTHESLIKAALDPQTGGYDFYPYFEYVAPLFQRAHWVFGNLETRLGGESVQFTGYPMFNAPDQLAFAMKRAGFTMVATANNHCLDRRKDGVFRTNQMLDQIGLVHTGTSVNPEDRNRPRILEKNGLRMAFLAYTYGTNGIPIPQGEEYLVNLIDRTRMAVDLALVRALDVDFVVCSIHQGVEYMRKPNAEQLSLFQWLFDQGVDVVLGHHPHVVQPYRLIRGEKSDRLAIYSMGNFIANQNKEFTQLGVIFKMDLIREEDGRKRIADLTAWPTQTIRRPGPSGFRILPLEQVVANEARYGVPAAMLPGLRKNLTTMNDHLRSMLG